MGKKWWYTRGVQTQLLLILLCLAQHVLAKPTATVSSKKSKASTATKTNSQVSTKTLKSHASAKLQAENSTTKNKSAHEGKSTAKSSTSISTTSGTSKDPDGRKASIEKGQNSSRSTAVTREKENKRDVTAKTSSKETAKTTKSYALSKSLAISPPKKASTKTKNHSESSAASRYQDRSTRTKSVRVLALKETKQHTFVKALVTVPVIRSATHALSKTTHSPTKPETFSHAKLASHVSSAPAVHDPVLPIEMDTASPEIRTDSDTLSKPEATLAKIESDEGRREWARYTPERAGFVIKLNEERLLYRVNSAFVLPGDEIFLDASDSQQRTDYILRSSLGAATQPGPAQWHWQAPREVGLYPVKVTNPRSGDSVTLHIFVMVPHEHVDGGYLNGYRIGTYPTVALRQLPIYNRPRGFIEVTPANEDTLVSPHFRLRQFLCKQDGDYPKYMILDPHLLTALELLLEKVNARGYHCRTFCVMSGYRTPYYNRAIGNSTTYSRHLWGDAADIFIDENPQDGVMDDLNHDGAVDSQDAAVLYDLVDNEYEPRFQQLLTGGLARYRETASHGPFVHVDVRGLYTRWGVRTTQKGLTPSATSPIALQNGGRSQAPRSSFWEPETTTEPEP